MTHLLSLIAIAAQLASTTPEEETTSGMHPPVAIAHGSADGQRVVEGLAGVLADTLSPLDRTRLGRKVLSKSRVSIAKGDFGDGGTRIVAVNVNLRMKDPEATQQYISGIFTVDDSGGLVAVVVSGRMRPERFSVEKVGDYDGDGRDDLVYVSEDAEGASRHRVTWDGSAPKTTTLQGAS
ncbi:MAG: hypothetical protein ACE37F_29810 [Nannocystaceae bacterium]|nr:hypothetical protein [bacterium]